jgi:hypothetical protein
MAMAKAQQTVRQQVLEAATEAVCGSRDVAYGKPENNFRRIASLWTAWIESRGGVDQFTQADVAVMLALVKLGRLAGNLSHQDSWIDLAGYAACGAEVTHESQG